MIIIKNRRSKKEASGPIVLFPALRPRHSMLPSSLFKSNKPPPPRPPTVPKLGNRSNSKSPLRRTYGGPATAGSLARGIPAARRGGPVSTSPGIPSAGAAAEAAAAVLRGAALRVGPPRCRFLRRAPRRQPGRRSGAPLRRALDGHAPVGALEAPRRRDAP
jgi:hypothetical protein